MERMSPRQREVATLVASGLADKQIARQLGISIHTVRWHLRAAREVTGTNSRVALAVGVVRALRED